MGKKYLFSTILAMVMFSNANASFYGNEIVKTDISSFIKTAKNIQEKYAPNEAIIRFKKSAKIEQIILAMQKIFKNFTHQEYSIVKAMAIKVPDMSYEQIKSVLENNPFISQYIEAIEKNYAHKVFKTDDSYYDKLWAIENVGQKVNGKKGTNDADMDVNEAWNYSKGSSDVVVAVLDTGVDYTHNDLADNMWRGNVHHGYDFAGDNDGNNDNDPMPDEPYDDNGHYHGTHVAGTIGAVGDNSLGVTGVVQNVQIMAVKVFRPNGYGYTSDILEGLDYVSKQIDNGVNIVAINASYGGGGNKGDTTDKAIAKLGKKGVVFCAAAGNDAKNIDNDPVYPASYSASNIIAVAASDQDDKLASFSNYGKKTVDVAAPGTNILSTYPDNKYAYLQGTSMATPQVTGSVALLASLKPESSVDERIKVIEDGVDKKDNLVNKISSSGRVNLNNSAKLLDKDNNGGGGGNSKNNPPVANNDNAKTDEDKSVIIDVLANDSDVDGDSLTIKSVANPKHGVAVIENNKIKYTPNKDYNGKDSFTYTISDGNGGEANADVNITVNPVNDKPVAKDDSAKTDENKSVTIDVLANDSDVDGDSLSIKSVTNPSHGTVEIKNNKILYTPNKDYYGDDSFEYSISDGNGGEASAKVSVTVYKKENNNGGFFGGLFGGGDDNKDDNNNGGWLFW